MRCDICGTAIVIPDAKPPIEPMLRQMGLLDGDGLVRCDDCK